MSLSPLSFTFTDIKTGWRRLVETINDILNFTFDSSRLTTQAEMVVSATPVDRSYLPGQVYRYGTNTMPGTTDMTSTLNVAANACRQGNYTLQLPPETCLVSGSLNFSNIRVVGSAIGYGSGAYIPTAIKASTAQFDVITSTGGSTFENFIVDGGWDGVTAGQSGDTFSLIGAPFAYNINFYNVTAINNKKRGVYWVSGGYSHIEHLACVTSGLHGIEIFAPDIGHTNTTIFIYGNSIFSICPNGYGAKLTECVAVVFDGVIMENNAHGIQLNGNDNRALTFRNVYQEVIADNIFLNATGSAGAGLLVEGCYDPAATITGTSGWQGVCFGAANVLTGVPFQVPALTMTGGLSLATPASAVQTSALYAGSGAPSNTNGNNGDYYFRSDTPGTANQRLYVKSAGAWAGIV